MARAGSGPGWALAFRDGLVGMLVFPMGCSHVYVKSFKSLLVTGKRFRLSLTDGSAKSVREGAARLPLETGISYRRGVLLTVGD